MTPLLDFSIVKQTGISQLQFAKLCGVSRETANTWINGGTKPGRVRARRVAKVIAVLARAHARGTLPVKADTRHAATQRVLDALATSHLKG